MIFYKDDCNDDFHPTCSYLRLHWLFFIKMEQWHSPPSWIWAEIVLILTSRIRQSNAVPLGNFHLLHLRVFALERTPSLWISFFSLCFSLNNFCWAILIFLNILLLILFLAMMSEWWACQRHISYYWTFFKLIYHIWFFLIAIITTTINRTCTLPSRVPNTFWYCSIWII